MFYPAPIPLQPPLRHLADMLRLLPVDRRLGIPNASELRVFTSTKITTPLCRAIISTSFLPAFQLRCKMTYPCASKYSAASCSPFSRAGGRKPCVFVYFYGLIMEMYERPESILPDRKSTALRLGRLPVYPELLGQPVTDQPSAEYWMGAHQSAPSILQQPEPQPSTPGSQQTRRAPSAPPRRNGSVNCPTSSRSST